jgi:hypothetical protein
MTKIHPSAVPVDWEAMSDQERSAWYGQERVKKQAMGQDTAWSDVATDQIERERRRIESRNGFVIGRTAEDE